MLRNYVKPLLKSVLVDTIKAPIRLYTPRRALMYVPGDDLKKVLKAFLLDADSIVLDCEDGVALNKKVQARINIRDILDKGKPQRKRPYDFAVRINSVASELIKDDLSVLVTGKNLPNTIYLPKVENVQHLETFSGYLDEYVKAQSNIGLIIAIESAFALVNVVDICKAAIKMSSKFTPVALLFGSDDFCASIGAKRTESSFEVTYARQKIVTVAKAFNLQAIDMVYIKYKDPEGLKKQAEEGAQLGFSGKQVIHPDQIDITQKAFMPNPDQIKWAQEILNAFYKHQKEGKGAFSYKGHMIDMPTVKQAQNVVDLANAIMININE
ncbi:citramalyl-CoA lyase, mitochondrial [Tribolium castaneum]|uniref:Citramalyl-CoA lyase, mitochondrial n=1 Tax=Tribolium castaneum TaxID=7070 RepID=D6WVA3_TRICA|nr:PREDICTED: citrate lyase subunit beta-like protein, mitochondrial [Tribolium castaneum]EFA09094.2 Citrate lyase subunit beta-like protein, mitochondrial [Tribolium castaneum]|eukprot:XP_008197511.1 PREDICTED: citrate lyase subunit beta-like protein, mitochondrial [Tribolium castaneum]